MVLLMFRVMHAVPLSCFYYIVQYTYGSVSGDRARRYRSIIVVKQLLELQVSQETSNGKAAYH